MKALKQVLAISVFATLMGTAPAFADAAKPGQSMTHIKTVAGVASLLESANVIIYLQGGATSAVMGESLAAPDGRYIFHIPLTAKKSGLEHLGSNIVFFNTDTNKQVQLRNPMINLATGDVSATVTQAENKLLKIFTITNASALKAKVSDDRATRIRSTSYAGANLNLAPGFAQSLNTLLGLSEGTIPEGTNLATADITIYGKAGKNNG